MYDQVIRNLRKGYNQMAEERSQKSVAAWKVEERAHFLSLLQQEGKTRLLEVGAGHGRDSKFFQDNGLDVVCKRFFSYHTDEDIQQAVAPFFEQLYFKPISLTGDDHFQSMILRRK